MTERTIKLTLTEQQHGHHGMPHTQTFIITLGENGAEIRSISTPPVSRDTSAVAYFGIEPTVSTVIVRVEEQP